MHLLELEQVSCVLPSLDAGGKNIEKWRRRTRDLMWDFQENLKEKVNDLIEEITEVTPFDSAREWIFPSRS